MKHILLFLIALTALPGYTKVIIKEEMLFSLHPAVSMPNATAKIKIYEDIQKEDIAAIEVLKKRFDKKEVELSDVSLDSLGGDLEASIKIAEMLRTMGARIIVPPNAICYSACVFILAAGKVRTVEGRVGIHRPYTINTSYSFTDTKKIFTRLEFLVRPFLKESGVLDTLWDDMIKIPPDQIRHLTPEQLAQYGLTGMDPAFEDYLDGIEASKYRLSKTKYYEVKAIATEMCKRKTSKHADKGRDACVNWTIFDMIAQ